MSKHDQINHPKHYTGHPSGIECIQVTEHMGFNLGNAVKYIWRCDLKADAIEDLEKAKWYLNREIQKRKREQQTSGPTYLDWFKAAEHFVNHQEWPAEFADKLDQCPPDIWARTVGKAA